MIVNGKATESLSLTDRSIHYGDGSFTTMRVVNGHIQLFDDHLTRLKEANQRLFIEFDNWEYLKSSALKYAHEIQSGVMKAVITRGSGGRGYGTHGVEGSSFILFHSSVPNYYQQWIKSGIEVGLSQHYLAKQPMLAGLKHLNRLEQVLIRREVEQSSYDDLLVCDQDGKLIEASMANVFWLIDKCWYTPKLDKCGVEGVMRNHVKRIINQSDSGVLEDSASPEVLKSADELFICNSVMGIVPVNRLYLPEYDHALSFENKKASALRETMTLSKETCE